LRIFAFRKDELERFCHQIISWWGIDEKEAKSKGFSGKQFISNLTTHIRL
jgi:hypothetical protein